MRLASFKVLIMCFKKKKFRIQVPQTGISGEDLCWGLPQVCPALPNQKWSGRDVLITDQSRPTRLPALRPPVVLTSLLL